MTERPVHQIHARENNICISTALASTVTRSRWLLPMANPASQSYADSLSSSIQMESAETVHLVPERGQMAGVVLQTFATIDKLSQQMDHVELAKTIRGQVLLQQARAAAVAQILARLMRSYRETAPAGNVKCTK